ncbi:MAG: NAD(P)H-quinone oxidoreductase [Rhodococcus sp.]|nr:NAD(P)H-quinone oxidoreductase [Rhodococcus sp. (in: high G+C Gram-positive bacteria)]
MYAISVPKPGNPDAMHWIEQDDPKPAVGEVLIDVTATAVNRADLLQRQGFYPPPPGASNILGLECSGTIAALGDGVTGWNVGDAVCALLSGGGYAEKVAVPAAQLLSIPDGLDLAAAAALPEVAATVWSNIVMNAKLERGEVFLVHGGGSGIGTHAIQVAKALGARVAVTAGSEGKLERCRELGADITINYRESDFVAALDDATDGHGADVILDNMGAAYLDRNIDALAVDGRLCIIGLQGGLNGEINLGKLLPKRGQIYAAGLRGRPISGRHSKGEIIEQVRTKVWPMIERAEVVPIIHAELPITDAPQAHRMLDAADTVGKVVLRVR